MDADTVDQVPTGPGGDATGQFLRLCLQARWNPAAVDAARALSKRDQVDWKMLLPHARREGVAPLLYDATRGQDLLPPWLEQELERDYFSTARRNLLLFEELEGILHALKRADVPAVLLKGAALAEVIYGNLALRPMWDIDLLVRERHLRTTVRTLTGLGFRAPGGDDLDGLTPRDVHANQLLFTKSAPTEMPIEVHWALFWFPYYQQAVPMDWFWRTALPARLGDVDTRMLGLEAQLLHLCGHLVHHQRTEGTLRLVWLQDVVEVVARFDDRVDWDALMDRAATFDLVVPVREVLWQVAEDWGAPIPAAVLDRLRRLRPSDREQRALAGLAATSRSMDTYALASLVAMPDWRARLGFLWHDLLFPSPGFMRRRYAIRHPLLLPLYYPYRWIRGVWAALRPRR
mgnify:FL=1